MDVGKTSPNNIDQIRRLIFGEQIQDYERRFKELIKNLETLKKTLQTYKNTTDDQVKATKQQLNQSITTIQKELNSQIQELNQRIQSLEDQIAQIAEDKLDKGQLADQLINLAMHLKGESILNQIDKDFS